MGAPGAELLRRLEQIIRGTPWLLRVLEAIRLLGLPDCYLAAGAVRNTVWDSLHGLATPGSLGDLDVIYFDRTKSWTSAFRRSGLLTSLQ
jgi:hypothetical protein